MKITKVIFDDEIDKAKTEFTHEGRSYSMRVYSNGNFFLSAAHEHADPIPIADLIAFAKAGGKVAEVDVRVKDDAICYRDILHDCNIPRGHVISTINKLRCEFNALKAQVAKLTKDKGRVKAWEVYVRCVDCENLQCGTVVDGYGKCEKVRSIHGDIYKSSICGNFTPAAAGCGSADQALRAELARVTEESGK